MISISNLRNEQWYNSPSDVSSCIIAKRIIVENLIKSLSAMMSAGGINSLPPRRSTSVYPKFDVKIKTPQINNVNLCQANAYSPFFDHQL